MKTITCRHPDRDTPKLLCGYPLPCPYHTATIDLNKNPPTVTIPITADAAWKHKSKLSEIADKLKDL